MASKIAKLNKNGVTYTLINPTYDIPIEILVERFGVKTLKVNYIDPHFEIEGMYGTENELGLVENLSGLDWEDIDL